MIFEDENYLIIEEKDFIDEFEANKEEVYLYHFIVVKYKSDKEIKIIKIDQVKDLSKLEDKEILYKYYIKKIHFYNDCSNEMFEHGEPYYIYNIGYFYIGGFIKTKDEELSKIKNMFEEYNKKYNNIKFSFDDKSYLSLNK